MQSNESVSENANFAKLCCLVVDICRDVLWDILLNYIAPENLQNKILSNLKIIKLHPEQIYRIRSLSPGSLLTAEYFDVSGLYRILRAICPNLPSPTRGWGQTPLAVDLTLADDIERINQLRNRIYGHTTTSNVSDCDFNMYWKDMRRVIGRIDGEFDTENLSKMRKLKSTFMDISASVCLKEELQRVMGFDKETRDIVCGFEERLAALEMSLNVTKDDPIKVEIIDMTNGCQVRCSHASNENEKCYDTVQDSNKDIQCSREDTVDVCPNLQKEMRMIVVGKTGSGKSSFSNTILGSSVFIDYYENVSCTVKAEISTKQRFGKKLIVCDTPGLFDTRFDNGHTRQQVSWCMVLTEPGPHAFILVLRCDVRFSLEECEVVTILEDNFGKNFYDYSVIVFTHRDHLERNGVSEDSLISRMPDKVQQLLHRVNQRYIFVNNLLSYEKNELVVKKLLDKINNIYEGSDRSVYQNKNLVENTLENKLEYKVKKWWQFWKWFW